MPQNPIVPTIGRKVWYFPVQDPNHPAHQMIFSRFDDQPLDATIVYVHPKVDAEPYQRVNLFIIDHAGLCMGQQKVALVQEGDIKPTDEAFVAWMPYQLKQANETAAASVPAEASPAPVPPSAPTPVGTAPRVTEGDLNDNIANVEIVKHVSSSGQILRWAVLTTRSGFSVTGRPSAAVSPENDNQAEGEKIAFENAKDELWPLMGYALKEKLSAK